MSQTTQHLAVTGMTCPGCVNALTRVLSRVPGVANVHVTLEPARADIAGTAGPDALIAAIRNAGYGAEPLPA
ncbi:MAG TPA: heavy-metal-associated domain-containing protein [Acetobacteraceae bacterium]|nr:heavy-metal-associated domain-containing protein [Acetobacteraceae bacterium]